MDILNIDGLKNTLISWFLRLISMEIVSLLREFYEYTVEHSKT